MNRRGQRPGEARGLERLMTGEVDALRCRRTVWEGGPEKQGI
jgi:hypothetical protein